MFCEKCGAQMENDSRFCLNCGAPVAAAPAAAPVAAPPAPGKSGFFANKNNVIILSVAAAVVAVIVVVCILLGLPKTIYMDDYITIRYDGLSTQGTARLVLDGEALEAALMEEMSATEMQMLEAKLFKSEYVLELSKTENLSNGDEISIILIIDNEVAKDYNVQFKLRNETVTVEGLKEPVFLDPFQDLEITYSGFAPNAQVQLQNNATNECLQNNVYYYIDNGYNLEEGETFTVEASFSEYDANQAGYIILHKSKEYTATNVPQPVELDLFKDLEIVFTGCSPYGKVSVQTKSTNEFILNNVNYYITNGKNLEEGETFTVSASFSSYQAEKNGYIITVTEKEYTAANLPAPTPLNVFDYVNVYFTGIEGSGQANYSFTSDIEFLSQLRFEFSRSYSLKAGEVVSLSYTLRYSSTDPLAYGYTLTGETMKQFTVPTLGQYVTDFKLLSDAEQTKILNKTAELAKYYLTKESAENGTGSINLKGTQYSDGNQLLHAMNLSNVKLHSVVAGCQEGWWSNTQYLVFVYTVDITSHPNITENNGNATGYFYLYIQNPVVKADGTLEINYDNDIDRPNYCYLSLDAVNEAFLNNIKNQVVYTPEA